MPTFSSKPNLSMVSPPSRDMLSPNPLGTVMEAGHLGGEGKALQRKTRTRGWGLTLLPSLSHHPKAKKGWALKTSHCIMNKVQGYYRRSILEQNHEDSNISYSCTYATIVVSRCFFPFTIKTIFDIIKRFQSVVWCLSNNRAICAIIWTPKITVCSFLNSN